MPTNRKKRKRIARSLDAQHIDQLIIGWPMLAGTGFSEGIAQGCGSWSAAEWQTFRKALREGWRQHGASFMAWWRGDTEQFTGVCGQTDPREPSVTPWALAEFGDLTDD